MNVIFMGTPDFAVPSLSALINSRHSIKAVFTQPDKPSGRGRRITSPPVKVLAEENNIPVFQPDSLKSVETVNIIKDINPDIIIVAAYGKILPQSILEIPTHGCINVHGSLLPKYRGAAPIQWAVLNGDKVTGVATMLMEEGLDTGDVLLTAQVEIGENETASELFDRLSLVGAKLLIETLDAVEWNTLNPKKQEESLASYAPMLTKDMSFIDFSKSAEQVHHHILGLSDWPCAATFIDGKRIKVYRCEIVNRGDVLGKCGEVLDETDFTVACKKGAVRFTEIQAEGSKRMAAVDFLRGRAVKKGTILG